MIVTTKYNPGDEVWTISKNKLTKGKIIKPCFIGTQSIDDLGWELDIEEYFMGFSKNISRKESELFLSKEDLIQSLYDNN